MLSSFSLSWKKNTEKRPFETDDNENKAAAHVPLYKLWCNESITFWSTTFTEKDAVLNSSWPFTHVTCGTQLRKKGFRSKANMCLKVWYFVVVLDWFQACCALNTKGYNLKKTTHICVTLFNCHVMLQSWCIKFQLFTWNMIILWPLLYLTRGLTSVPVYKYRSEV